MAYSYQLNMFGGSSEGYVKYNISPAYSVNMGLGDTFTITGQAYWHDSAIKSITVLIGTGRDTYGFPTGTTVVGTVNKSISKGKTGTFSITCTVSQALINSGVADANGLFNGYVAFDLWASADGSGSGSGTFANASQKFSIIKARTAPVISGVSLGDLHSAISGNQTPYQYFGGYVQGQSLPRFVVGFSTDSRDTKLTASHTLAISGGNLPAARTYTKATTAGASSVTFNLPAPDFYGTISYTYTVTDSAGMTSTQTGTFTVHPYSLPSLTGFSVTRYKTELDDQGYVDKPADDGTKIWITLSGNVTAIASKNGWSLSLMYGTVDTSSRTTVNVASAADGQAIAYVNDKTIFTVELTAATTFELTAVLTDMLGSVQTMTLALKAGGYLNVEKTGVAVGMRTTATQADKKFEVADDYTTHFYGAIAATEEYTPEMLTGVDTPGSLGGALVFRRVGNMVFVTGTIKLTSASTGLEVCDVPNAFMPTERITWIAAVTGSRIARLYIHRRADDTGVLVLEWVKGLSSTSNVSEAFTWIDCGITYWAG